MESPSSIAQRIWQGTIPVMFQLTPNEISTLQPPRPFYLLVPRNSYFPLETGLVRKHFLGSTPALVDEMWLEYKGKPLKWHYPVGVLFDLLAGQQDVPWSLHVHFQGFPSEHLLRCPDNETVRRLYFNVLKESNFVKTGDSQNVNNLSVVQANELWDSLKANSHDKFLSVNSKLVPDVQSVKHIPVRVFCKSNPGLCMQEPVEPLNKSTANPLTLGELMHNMLPNLFDSASGKSTVLVQGISPSLETPINWLSENFSHPDSFLYIIVVDTL